ncbi:DUF2064 domain-containing protein [Aquimarina sp. AU474]|uniref:TIGR04282 family arsenosugar biosynthesis glycosyltransferase n=1 Tax=Aquimarina sp. AU474 TaxID=2108529 RepID=UPI000D695B64|nr:DUF2064 domain-containing protein [Aquimarina sp. AU474]
MNSKTAILVFANSAQEEALRKPISGGQQLFTELNSTIESVVVSTKLPYYIVTEVQQQGRDFGERFVNAVQGIYEKGFENVITIGNDTPFLTKKHLLDSAKLLEKNKFVIGPSVDGGFYLMGLHKSQFDPLAFLKLPWRSKKLAKSITALLKNNAIEVAKLQVLYDIDSIEDLKIIKTFGKVLSKSLLKIIQLIFQYSNTINTSNTLESYTTYTFISYNKGSPRLIMH